MDTDKHRLKVRPNWSAEHLLGALENPYRRAETVLGAPVKSAIVNRKSKI